MTNSKILVILLSMLFLFSTLSLASSIEIGSSDLPTSDGSFTVLAVHEYNDLSKRLDLDNIETFEDLMVINNWELAIKYKDTEINEWCFLNNEGWSDILYYSGHGVNTAENPKYVERFGFPENSSGVVVPDPVEPSNLIFLDHNDFGTMDDYRWIILNSCYVVNNENSYLHRVFTDNSSSAHAILGFNTITYDSERNIKRFINYLFGTDGYSQKSVLSAWKYANLEIFPEIWSAFYLEGAKDELITNPLDYVTNYDIWYTDFIEFSVPVISDPFEPPFPTPNPNPLPITASTNLYDSYTINKVNETLYDGKIELNYEKPSKEQVYSLGTVSEISNSQSVESEFYSTNQYLLPGLFHVNKIEYLDKTQYKIGSENVLYFKSTGAVIYQKEVSPNPINNDLEETITCAEDFINDFGGGLPYSAKLDKVYGTRHKNLRTGETEIQSYIL